MCPDEITLSAYFDGEVSLKERADIASHIRECSLCQSRIASFESHRTLLHDLALKAIPGDTVPEFTYPDNSSTTLSSRSKKSGRRRIGSLSLPWPLAAAAALLLMFLTFSYVRLETRIASGQLVYVDDNASSLAEQDSQRDEPFNLENELAVISLDIPLDMGELELGDAEFSFDEEGVIWED